MLCLLPLALLALAHGWTEHTVETVTKQVQKAVALAAQQDSGGKGSSLEQLVSEETAELIVNDDGRINYVCTQQTLDFFAQLLPLGICGIDDDILNDDDYYYYYYGYYYYGYYGYGYDAVCAFTSNGQLVAPDGSTVCYGENEVAILQAAYGYCTGFDAQAYIDAYNAYLECVFTTACEAPRQCASGGSSKSKKSSSDASGGVIAAIVISVLFGVGAIFALSFYLMNQRRAHRPVAMQEGHVQLHGDAGAI